MKLKFVGGTGMRWVDGERREVQLESLEQNFEECEYAWPKVGTVLSVTDEVGGWLQYKLGKLIERLPDDPAERPKAAPRAIVAVDVEAKREHEEAKRAAAISNEALQQRVAELEARLAAAKQDAGADQAGKHRPTK